MRVSEIRVNQIRVNQGLGVFQTWILQATQAAEFKFEMYKKSSADQ